MLFLFYFIKTFVALVCFIRKVDQRENGGNMQHSVAARESNLQLLQKDCSFGIWASCFNHLTTQRLFLIKIFFLLTCVSLEQAVGAPEVLRVLYNWDLGHPNDDCVRSHI